jgi:O-antigen/teichoic acid export membrane protein
VRPFALSLQSLIKRLWRDASWSLAGNVLVVGSGLATLKIIGKLVPSAEYGAASLVLGAFALLNQFVQGPLLTERIRFYFDHLKTGDTRPLSQVLRKVVLASSSLVALIYLALATSSYLAGGVGVYLQLMVPVLILIFTQPQISVAMAQLEAHRDYRAISLLQPSMTVLQLPFLLGLIWLTVAGSQAIVFGQALAGLTILAIFRYLWRDQPEIKEPTSALANFSISSFGWALYAFNVASWILSTADRYLIDALGTRQDVGIYVINYSLASIPYTILNGWVHSVTRPRLYTRAAAGAAEDVFKVILGSLGAVTALSVIGTGIFYLVGKRLGLMLLGDGYWHSERLLLTLAAAHIFYCIGHTSSAYFVALKRPQWVWITCLIAGIVNIGANCLLLPRFGIQGAAFATLGAYLLWAILMLSGVLRAWAGSRAH